MATQGRLVCGRRLGRGREGGRESPTTTDCRAVFQRIKASSIGEILRQELNLARSIVDGSSHDEGKRADGHQAVAVVPAGDMFGTGNANDFPRKEIGFSCGGVIASRCGCSGHG